MVNFKENKGKVVFGFTIVLIILFLLLSFLLFVTRNMSDLKGSVLIFIAQLGFVTAVLSLVLSILNNIYRKDKELSDSDTMDNALSAIPIIILVFTFLIGGISINSSKSTSSNA